jgi:hypothetical protein
LADVSAQQAASARMAVPISAVSARFQWRGGGSMGAEAELRGR